jgi:hypothetical protein
VANDMASSPDRGTFQRDAYIARCNEEGREPDAEHVRMMNEWQQAMLDRKEDPDWQEDNLEHTLRSTRWVIEKARASDTYAQNIYAAMCNMRWQKRDVLLVLKDQYWSCSWRSAGGIVADILGKGDYIDWYCSGIGDGLGNGDADGTKGYVPEGVVTQEIEDDFYKLGWIHSEWPKDDV